MILEIADDGFGAELFEVSDFFRSGCRAHESAHRFSTLAQKTNDLRSETSGGPRNENHGPSYFVDI